MVGYAMRPISFTFILLVYVGERQPHLLCAVLLQVPFFFFDRGEDTSVVSFHACQVGNYHIFNLRLVH